MNTPDDVFYREWYKHDENLSTNRGSSFLVGQSMLFAGYAALRGGDETATVAITTFCVVGGVAAVVWVLLGVMHLVGTRRPLTCKLNQHESRGTEISSGRWPPWLNTYSMMAFVLPSLVTVAWIVLLLLA